MILGGLTELSRATGDDSYITKAKEIADAAIAALTQDGILHDACEPDCGGDGSQFKGRTSPLEGDYCLDAHITLRRNLCAQSTASPKGESSGEVRQLSRCERGQHLGT